MTTEQFNAWLIVDPDVLKSEELTFEEGEREFINDIIGRDEVMVIVVDDDDDDIYRT